MGVAAAVEGRIAGGIDQHAVTGGREIERGGRVAVAGVGGRVAVDPERPFFAGVAQAFEVEAEPVDILAGSERQFEAAAAAADGEFDLRSVERRLRVRQFSHRFAPGRLHIHLLRGRAVFGLPESEPENTG